MEDAAISSRHRHDDLRELLEAEGPGLHALLFRLTWREEVAEDLLQDLFVRLSGNGAWKQAKNPAAYATRTAINLALDWRRRQSRDARLINSKASTITNQQTRDHSPLASLSHAEEMARILDLAARELTGLVREAFILRFVQQVSYETVGQVLERTPHQARGLCHRALATLRTKLKDPPQSSPSTTNDPNKETTSCQR